MRIGHVEPTHTLGARRPARPGMTLVEVVVALSVLVIGASAAVYGLLGVSVLARVQAERALAFEAGRNALEALQGEDFRTAFVRFNATNADDPPAGASPGNAFDAQGLSVRPGDPDGRVGSIEFPGNGVRLLENVNDPELGMPRDLGGALGLDPDDHAIDYTLLPVRVRVQWRGAAGNEEVVLAATLSNDKNAPSP
jgi:prepilin-type N-terminal cleavage/methylation domain-containing protein